MKYFVFTFFLTLSLQAQEINVEQLQDVTNEIDRVTQSPSETCELCAGELDQETINKSLMLDQRELEVSTNYVGGEDYVIALKRTASTPKKIKVKIEYGERICARTIAHQNPLSGQLGFSCLFYQTEKRSKTVHFDFSNASALEGEEFQSLRLVLHKERDERSLDHQLKITNGMFDIIKEEQSFLGLFGHKYAISRRVGSRAPAVIPDYE